eukprot:CAMPEP_0118953862 /NCGR_PEP_ID=MMETSP1169-20130426/57278_1 /TAXON_ID=36882 /ORGANISM="Pyramimonas obovata, Strain CCMP722" /LENGTH=349 /DNA_ID=CAMNT_0006901407 /DNA_START=489 /DNA_END=1534 /DNA_ORIENTATION=-
MEGSAVASQRHRNTTSEETTSKPEYRMTGLQNLNNTCYINSVLQALNNLEPFRKLFISPEVKKLLVKFGSQPGSPAETNDEIFELPGEAQLAAYAINAPVSNQNQKTGSGRKRGRNGDPEEVLIKERKVNKTHSLADRAASIPGRAALTRSKRASLECDGAPVSISCELYRLLLKLSSGQYSILSPNNLLKVIWKLLPTFANLDQQDAHEFMCFLIDRLRFELALPSSWLEQTSRERRMGFAPPLPSHPRRARTRTTRRVPSAPSLSTLVVTPSGDASANATPANTRTVSANGEDTKPEKSASLTAEARRLLDMEERVLSNSRAATARQGTAQNAAALEQALPATAIVR